MTTEKKTQHTPGPWGLLRGAFPRKTSNYEKRYRASIYPSAAPEFKVVSPIAYALADHSDECEANARLIAAAPRMLDFIRLVAIGDAGPIGARLLLDEIEGEGK